MVTAEKAKLSYGVGSFGNVYERITALLNLKLMTTKN